MHVTTFYRQRRGSRTFEEAVRATGLNPGTLSRIERGEQFPKGGAQIRAIASFYDEDGYEPCVPPLWNLTNLYPPSIPRCLQLERNCTKCGKPLPPESRANRRRHMEGGCT